VAIDGNDLPGVLHRQERLEPALAPAVRPRTLAVGLWSLHGTSCVRADVGGRAGGNDLQVVIAGGLVDWQPGAAD
jgi:hypothetical protein